MAQFWQSFQDVYGDFGEASTTVDEYAIANIQSAQPEPVSVGSDADDINPTNLLRARKDVIGMIADASLSASGALVPEAESAVRARIRDCLEMESRLHRGGQDAAEAVNLLQYVLGKTDSFLNKNPLHRAKLLVQLILETNKERERRLPLLRPSGGQHPLFMAIEFDIGSKKDEEPSDLARFLCSVLDQREAADAISTQNAAGETCLHQAIRKDLDGVEEMIDLAHIEIFQCQSLPKSPPAPQQWEGPREEHDGNTPLHDALHHSKCYPAFPGCPPAVRWLFKAVMPDQAAPVTSAQPNQHRAQVQAPRPDASGPAGQANKAGQPLTRRPTLPPSSSELGANACSTCKAAAQTFLETRARRLRILEKLLQRDSHALTVHNSTGQSPYLYFTRDATKAAEAAARSTNTSLGGPGERGALKPSDVSAIAKGKGASDSGKNTEPSIALQGNQASPANKKAPMQGSVSSHELHHLRTDLLAIEITNLCQREVFELGGYEKAYQCLFPSQKAATAPTCQAEADLDVFFILDGKTQRISHTTTSNFNYLQFAPEMAKVVLSLEYNRDRVVGSLDEVWKSDQLNIINVFKWLKGRKDSPRAPGKGVRSILKLVVLDNKERPCSDETVEKCLDGLEIRYLDWNTPDLAAETLGKAKELVELDLYWSGLRAVMSGWLDTKGLSILKSLRTIRLHARPGREEAGVQLLKDLVVVSNPGQPESDRALRKVIPADKNKKPQASSGAEGRSDDSNDSTLPHPWIKAAKAMGEWLVNLDGISERPPGRDQLVKIALLDDGVDPTFHGVGRYLAHPRWPRDSSSDPKPLFLSSKQHGSKLAWLIKSVCPHVRIYVGKLTYESDNGLRQRSFSLKQAKDAIDWAVRCKVDIISMSWSVRKLSEKKGNQADDIEALKTSIDNASKANILMFCAAGDNMGNSRSDNEWLPCGWPETRSIGATDRYNGIQPYVVQRGVDYYFPGEYLFVDIDKSPTTYQAGNSGATALASGLAALVLFCMRREKLAIPKDVAKFMDRVMTNVFTGRDGTNLDKVVQSSVLIRAVNDNMELKELAGKFSAQFDG
ncbi:hypothetical protein RB600_008111 [Gaeumannomyces tritici]